MQNKILQNLGDIVKRVRDNLNSFDYEDIQLSIGFRKAFAHNVSMTGNSVEFKKTTAVITNSAGQKIYAPNQWFVLATYPVELVKEIIRYRNITEGMLEKFQSEFVKNDGTQVEKKDIYKCLKSGDSAIIAKFESCIIKYLKSLNQNTEEIQENTKLIMRFVTDDKWWLGGKGIERTNDFYVSPILGSLNLVNASQSYVATITYAYVNDEELYKELGTIIASSDSDDVYEENEYERAATTLKNHVLESGLVFEESEEDVKSIYDEFQARFSPKQLLSIPDNELLEKMFYSAESTNDSLCYWLEFEQHSRKLCGSIAGGSSFKFGLFQRKDDGVWITGSPSKPEEISDDKALDIAKSIREVLVQGAEIIKTATLDSLEDYEKLDESLNSAIGKYASLGWVHKYFHLLYPDKLSAFHSSDWQKHVLYALRIEPSDKYYTRSGQIAIVGRYANWKYRFLYEAFFDKFGGIKKFYRLGTSDNDGNYAEEWKKQGVAAIGWNDLGCLEDYVVGNDINKKALSERMQEMYYPDNPQLASRKAGEVASFYRTNTDSVFVAMDGNTPLALIDDMGSYYYDSDKKMAHRKQGTWHCCFKPDEKLPNKSVGHMTSCYEISDDEDLMYLYEKYFYDLEDREEAGEDEMQEVVPETIEYIKPEYNTEFETDFERNKIVFGAPGTGKSYKLKKQADELIGCAENHMERVTFHSDYTYSQFVGSYKPVTDAVGNIRYDFVPGPFMRVYVNAVKNTQQIIRVYDLIEQADTMYMFPTNPNPYNEEEKWDLFEEITEVGQEESFRASKDAKVGDLALIYVAKTKPGYENGIYAIGRIVKKETEDRVIIRFDYVSYRHPIIDYETLKDYNPNIRSNGRVGDDIVNLVKETIIPANPYLLLIEEINRAKVAAVFGDVFQLLDRGDEGVSEYDIQTSEDVRKYLAAQLGGEPQNWLKIKLPDNMFIWATMNSADQGVFPMDTAFKRRWAFEYLGINDGEKDMSTGLITLGKGETHQMDVDWNQLRKTINERLSSNDFKVNEDKLMGPFFLAKKVTEADENGRIANPEAFIKAFKSKVIMYLYEDAAKQHKHKLFSGCDSSKYSSVCDAFDEIGIDIFGDGIRELYKQQEG